MGQAEVISLDEVRASKPWASLRQQLHDHFDQWLDDLQAHLPEPETTLAQITETMWALHQDLLCCRCCQALSVNFFLPFLLSFRSCFQSDALVLLNRFINAHMSRYGSPFGVSTVRGNP